MKRSTKTVMNLFGALFSTWLCAEIGWWLIRTKSEGIASSWCAFLLVIVVSSWIWGFLLSAKPAEGLDLQKKTATIVTLGNVWLFGFIAISVTMTQGNPTKDERVLSSIIFTGALLALPWMYHEYKRMMAWYEDSPTNP